MNFIGFVPILYYFFFINEFFQNNYPIFQRYTTNMIINISYKLIEFYSRTQLFFRIIKRKNLYIYDNFAKSNPNIVKFIENQFPKKIIQNVEFVLDGKVICRVNSMELCNSSSDTKLQPLFLLSMDFLIYTEINTDNPERPITYKKIINTRKCTLYDKTFCN